MSDAGLLREAWACLGADRSASAKQVRAAWKRKLKEVHPDMGGTKEAAQHATNMRDVLLAWIEAGRPDLAAECNTARAAHARATAWAQGSTWQDVPQRQPPDTSSAGWGTLIAVWAIALLLTMLIAISDSQNRHNRMRAHQQQLMPHPYNLPPCNELNLFDETKAMIEGRCWPRRSR